MFVNDGGGSSGWEPEPEREGSMPPDFGYGFNPGWGPPIAGGWQPSTPDREGYWTPPTYAFPGSPAAPTSAQTPYGGGSGQPNYNNWWRSGTSWGGGGGGGGGGGPEMQPWEGDIPNTNPWFEAFGWGGETMTPWDQWENTPWANLPEENQALAMQWFNTILPWQQSAMDWTQFQQQQAFNQWQTEAQLQNYLQQRALESFGRRWAPSSRWM